MDLDVFPPARSRAPDHLLFLPFTPEDIAFEEEYEEYLSDLGWADDQISADDSMFTGGTSAWHRLPNFVSEMTEGISDTESVITIKDLGDAKVAVSAGDVERDGDSATTTLSVRWTLTGGEQWSYAVPARLVDTGGTWVVTRKAP